MQVVEIIGQEVAPLQSLPGPHGLIDIYTHCMCGPTTETAEYTRQNSGSDGKSLHGAPTVNSCAPAFASIATRDPASCQRGLANRCWRLRRHRCRRENPARRRAAL